VTALRRRVVLAAATLAVAPLLRSQEPTRLPVLGILSPHPRPAPKFIADNPFTNRLRALGWEEGRNLRIERAYGDGREDLLPELAAALVTRRLDAIWTFGFKATVAALRATRSIPIVFSNVPYPLEQGVVPSLSRPGGNVTGVAYTTVGGLRPKIFEILREIAPGARRLASLETPSATFSIHGRPIELLPRMREVAAELGFELRVFAVERQDDLEGAFDAIDAWKPEVFHAAGTTVTVRERRRIAGFANRLRIPAGYTERAFVDAGGLVSYGLQLAEVLERAAHLVDRVLRGSPAGELPVELPSKYELAVNLGTAAAIGVSIPHSLLVRADKVIGRS